jgi:hypothetical protein
MSGIIGGNGSKSGIVGQTGNGWIKLWGMETSGNTWGATYVDVSSTVTTAGTHFTPRFDLFRITISHFSTASAGGSNIQQYINGSLVTSGVRRCVQYSTSNSSELSDNSDSTSGITLSTNIGVDATKGADGVIYVHRPWDDREKKIYGRMTSYQNVENRLNTTFTSGGNNNTGVLTGLKLYASSNINYAYITLHGLSKV